MLFISVCEGRQIATEDPSNPFYPNHLLDECEQAGALPTSVVGSLPRPRWLIDAIQRHERKELSEGELKESYDDAVKLAIREQELTGVDELSDGEQRRVLFSALPPPWRPSFKAYPGQGLIYRAAEQI